MTADLIATVTITKFSPILLHICEQTAVVRKFIFFFHDRETYFQSVKRIISIDFLRFEIVDFHVVTD